MHHKVRVTIGQIVSEVSSAKQIWGMLTLLEINQCHQKVMLKNILLVQIEQQTILLVSLMNYPQHGANICAIQHKKSHPGKRNINLTQFR
eukprot:15332777-Ditylum_brightwellii.AAC.1